MNSSTLFQYKYHAKDTITNEKKVELLHHLGQELRGASPWTIFEDRIIMCSDETQIMTITMLVEESKSPDDPW